MINTKGFILLNSIFFLNLIILSISLFMFILLTLNRVRKQEYECHKLGIKIQQILEQHKQQLFRLNPDATHIRKKVKMARRLLRVSLASGNPTTIFAARTFLFKTLAQQIKISLKQNQIIRSSNIYTLYKINLLRNSIPNKQFMKIPKMAIIRKPSHSITPNYYPNLETKLQNFYYSWTLFQNYIPLWIQKNIFTRSLNLFCSTNIKWENNQWDYLLNAVK